MNVLLLGSGGREHALAWKIKGSRRLKKLWIAPGNAGTSVCGTNVALQPSDFEGVKEFVLKNLVDMVIVGPEEPLVKGIHDFFLKDKKIWSIPVIGPQKAGAMLEGSKDFAKGFMMRNNIPTAAYRTFNSDNIQESRLFLESLKPPYVLKADGLAAGKGVIICKTLHEAHEAIENMINKSAFGESGKKVVIEEFLQGIEVSVFVITDGNNYKILPVAKDYKKIGEGDTGMNTGGMGSVSGVPFADKEFMEKVEKRIIVPTINGLRQEGIDYKGFIYFGLMKVKSEPFVIEYNVRLGDPEAEAVIPRIKNDLLEIFEKVSTGRLSEVKIEIDERFTGCVILVSGGYPGNYEKGKEITGLDKIEDSIVFHAGTAVNPHNNKIETSGGRVIAITSFGFSVREALNASYKNAEKIKFENKYYRKDIGFDIIY